MSFLMSQKNYIGEYDLVKSLDIVVSLYPSFPPLFCFYHLSKVHIAMILAMQKLCALAESSSSTPVLPMILTLPVFFPVILHHQPTLATPVGSFGTQNQIKLVVTELVCFPALPSTPRILTLQGCHTTIYPSTCHGHPWFMFTTPSYSGYRHGQCQSGSKKNSSLFNLRAHPF